MNFNNFTIKAQESIREAIELAQRNGQQSIESDSATSRLVGKNLAEMAPLTPIRHSLARRQPLDLDEMVGRTRRELLYKR